MSETVRQGITLRAALVALVGGAALYVAVIAAVISFGIAPTASLLRRHSEAMQAEFSAVRERTAALRVTFGEARVLLLVEGPQFDPGKPAAARALLARVQPQLDDTGPSVKTVSTQRTHILEKMHLRKNAELMQYVITHGLAEQDNHRYVHVHDSQANLRVLDWLDATLDVTA